MRSSPLRSLLALLAASACCCQPTGGDTTANTTTDGATTSPGTSSTGASTDLPTSDATTSDATTSGSTAGSGTATSSTSTTGEPPTSTVTTDGTTGGMVVFPTDCEDPLASPYADARVDTFFVNEVIAGESCSLAEDPADAQCRDSAFGAAPAYQIFHLEGGGRDPNQDLISLFAARFDLPQPKHDDLEIPQTSWVGVRVKFHVMRPDAPDPWKSMILRVLRFADGDLWESGNGLEFTPCVDPAASFRCRQCDVGKQPCLLPWGSDKGLPFAYPMFPVAQFELVNDPGAEGQDVVIDLPVDAVPWLTDGGMMVVPAPAVQPDALAVATLEAAPQLRPQLGVLYCPPVFQP